MAEKLNDGFNVWHQPGFRLTDQNLAEPGVNLNRNAVFETENHGDTKAYQRWAAVMSIVSDNRKKIA